MKTLKITISGSVQGISFRNFVKDHADRLGVKGFVRNLDNGDVEVVAEGKDENVNELLRECREGPIHAQVKETEAREIKHEGFKDFKILRL
jgi:acylphosphatase